MTSQALYIVTRVLGSGRLAYMRRAACGQYHWAAERDSASQMPKMQAQACRDVAFERHAGWTLIVEPYVIGAFEIEPAGEPQLLPGTLLEAFRTWFG